MLQLSIFVLELIELLESPVTRVRVQNRKEIRAFSIEFNELLNSGRKFDLIALWDSYKITKDWQNTLSTVTTYKDKLDIRESLFHRLALDQAKKNGFSSVQAADLEAIRQAYGSRLRLNDAGDSR